MLNDWAQVGQLVRFTLQIDGRWVFFFVAPKDIEPSLNEGDWLVPALLRHSTRIEKAALRAYRSSPHQGDGSEERPILVTFRK